MFLFVATSMHECSPRAVAPPLCVAGASSQTSSSWQSGKPPRAQEFKKRSELPASAIKIVDSLPKDIIITSSKYSLLITAIVIIII